MNGYRGPAIIITSDGTELDAHVNLFVDNSGRLKSWGGTATIANLNPLIIEEDDLVLRLPNGREGRIASFTHASTGSDEATFRGSGVPPFA